MYRYFFLNNNGSCTAAKAPIGGGRWRGGGKEGEGMRKMGQRDGEEEGGWMVGDRGEAGPGIICN